MKFLPAHKCVTDPIRMDTCFGPSSLATIFSLTCKRKIFKKILSDNNKTIFLEKILRLIYIIVQILVSSVFEKISSFSLQNYNTFIAIPNLDRYYLIIVKSQNIVFQRLLHIMLIFINRAYEC